MKLTPKEISIDDIILDPNNYRFREEREFRLVPDDKLHLEVNQNKALQRLKPEIPDLVRSIKSNGFLPVERVVVYEYPHSPGKYVVIEGNRRISSLKQIKDELSQGLFENDALSGAVAGVPCLIAEGEEIPAFRESLMGIRHVGGIKQWGGYQRAQLIFELRKIHGLDASTVADRVGLSVQEVNRRFRAISALNQMLSDEEYGEKADPTMYPLFHEAVALPAVRDWLGWDNEANEFRNNLAKEQFYDLLITTVDDEGLKTDPKLVTYQDVRQLREILANPQAKSYLLNPKEKFSAAISAANQDEIQRKWRDEVAQAVSALRSITLNEISSMSSDDSDNLSSLIAEAKRVIEAHGKLQA